jgi:hypothetical protein
LINRQNRLLNRVSRKVLDGYKEEELAAMTIGEMRLVRPGRNDSGMATHGNGWKPGRQTDVTIQIS